MGRSVNEWKQSGAVFTWRYIERAKNYPGRHLAFDSVGFVSFVDLLRRYVEDDGEAPLLRLVRLTPPTSDVLAIPNNGSAAIHTAERLRISSGCRHQTDGLSRQSDLDDLVLSIGRVQMVHFVAWLSDSESFDKTFGKAPEFWFWARSTARRRVVPANPPLQSDGRVGRFAPSPARR